MFGRDLVEETFPVSLPQMQRWARRASSWWGTLTWGSSSVQAGFKLPDEPGELGVLLIRWTCGGQPAEVRAQLVPTSQRLGGQRWWIVCPRCGRRCSSLFVGRTTATCRRCSGLAYRSQRERGIARAASAIIKLRRRYGGPADAVTPWFVGPPRMRWTTWERIKDRERRLMGALNATTTAWLERFEQRIASLRKSVPTKKAR